MRTIFGWSGSTQARIDATGQACLVLVAGCAGRAARGPTLTARHVDGLLRQLSGHTVCGACARRGSSGGEWKPRKNRASGSGQPIQTLRTCSLRNTLKVTASRAAPEGPTGHPVGCEGAEVREVEALCGADAVLDGHHSNCGVIGAACQRPTRGDVGWLVLAR